MLQIISINQTFNTEDSKSSVLRALIVYVSQKGILYLIIFRVGSIRGTLDYLRIFGFGRLSFSATAFLLFIFYCFGK